MRIIMNIFNPQKKWSRRNQILLFERLGMYISAGISVDGALRLSQKGMSKHLVANLASMQHEVESGLAASIVLSKYVGISDTIRNLIKQGETAAHLGSACSTAHGLLERQDELIKKCMSACMYPCIIGVFAGLLTLGLVRGVIPQIVPMLTSMKVDLPFLTRMTIWVSDTTASYGLYIFLMLILISVAFMYLYRRVVYVREIFHMISIRIPVIGNIILFYPLAVFLRSVGVLVSAGVPLTRAYRDIVSSVSLLPLRAILEPAYGGLERGLPLSSLLTHDRLPAHMSPLITAGESSGALGDSLIRAAAIIERDIDIILKRLTTLVEPVMMIGMGGVVGAIALSIMMPIYDMSKVLQHVH